MEATDTNAMLQCPEIMGLLWRAFNLRGCDDGLAMKAGLSRRFKAVMHEALLFVQQPNGDVTTKPDPRGGMQLPSKSVPFRPQPAEADYLRECVTELKGKRNQDGSPMITANAADYFEQIEDVLLPLWKTQPLPLAEVTA